MTKNQLKITNNNVPRVSFAAARPPELKAKGVMDANSRYRRGKILLSFVLGPLAFLLGIILLTFSPQTAMSKAQSTPEKDPGDRAAEQQTQETKADAHGGETAPDETADTPPEYKLGRALDGFYDCNLLRMSRRVESYRHPIGEIGAQHQSGQSRPIQIVFECVVEFGAETGMAEIPHKEDQIKIDLREIVPHQTPQDLMTPAGKRRLKAEIVKAINHRLDTARVRHVYFTSFKIGR